MNSKALADCINEGTAYEGRPDAESSTAKSSTKKFGVGKKWLIVFAAAVVASLIVNWLEGPRAYTEMDKAYGIDPDLQNTIFPQAGRVLGEASIYFLASMLIAAFVRGRGHYGCRSRWHLRILHRLHDSSLQRAFSGR